MKDNSNPYVNFEKIYLKLPKIIKNKLKNIKFIITDFDGVWTDNLVLHSQDGKETIVRSKLDSLGIDMLNDSKLYNKTNYLSLNHPVDILIISRESNLVLKKTSKKIKVKYLKNQYTKVESLKIEVKKRGLELNQVLYIGNDINDLECMKEVGLSVAVADSHINTLKIADYITKNFGGRGAIREIIELLILSKTMKD